MLRGAQHPATILGLLSLQVSLASSSRACLSSLGNSAITARATYPGNAAARFRGGPQIPTHYASMRANLQCRLSNAATEQQQIEAEKPCCDAVNKWSYFACLAMTPPCPSDRLPKRRATQPGGNGRWSSKSHKLSSQQSACAVVESTSAEKIKLEPLAAPSGMRLRLPFGP